MASNDTTILLIYKVAKAVFRHFEANKEGIELARAAIETAGAINKPWYPKEDGLQTRWQ